MAGIINSSTFVIEMFVYALLGGLLPALIWLWFWMHEGHEHKEPRHVISFTFILGMCTVLLVFPFQKGVLLLFPSFQQSDPLVIFIWAFFEEIIKFLAAYIYAFHISEVYDEPIDAFVYMMTAALGFSALENTLFLLTPLLQGDTIGSIMTGNLRFMGASLLHVVASGVLSLFIGYTFYKSKFQKIFFTAIGLITAGVLHTLFNFFIMDKATREQPGNLFIVFSCVWITTIFLIIALERVKLIKKF
jgi:RsiW-degrading membrane proteinase PrsW (M82 family)